MVVVLVIAAEEAMVVDYNRVNDDGIETKVVNMTVVTMKRDIWLR